MLFVDFETQSTEDLSAVGGRNYANHPNTRVLCLCWKDGERYCSWVPPHQGCVVEATHVGMDAPEELRSYTGQVCAHNANRFDKFVWERFVGSQVTWVDTDPMARSLGLPGALDSLAKHFTLGEKDAEGKSLMLKLTCLDENLRNKKHLPGFVRKVVQYCLKDVELLEALYKCLKELDLPQQERFRDKLMLVTNAVNDRGIGFDSGLACKLIDRGQELSSKAEHDIAKLLDTPLKLRSTKQMGDWVKSQGVELPDFRAATVDEFLRNPEEYLLEQDCNVSLVSKVLELRKCALKITGSKLAAGLRFSSNGRLKDTAQAYGAHTGRFAGRGMQLQNLPRGIKDVDIKGVISGSTTTENEAARLKASEHDVLSSLIRPCLYGSPLHIADWNAIETRCLAWMANEHTMLNAFRAKRDLYKETIARLKGKKEHEITSDERFLGKTIVLGCGYGMGHKKFARTCELQKVDLGALGMTAEACIKGYREAYPRVVQFWRDLESAAIRAVATGDWARCGKIAFFTNRRRLVAQLPSGRCIVYCNPRLEGKNVEWSDTEVTGLVYDNPRGTRSLYGGAIAENIVQGTCADLLIDALVKCEQMSLQPVLHVHDEIVTQGGRLQDLVTIMETCPPWAEGMPLSVEGHTSERYGK